MMHAYISNVKTKCCNVFSTLYSCKVLAKADILLTNRSCWSYSHQRCKEPGNHLVVLGAASVSECFFFGSCSPIYGEAPPHVHTWCPMRFWTFIMVHAGQQVPVFVHQLQKYLSYRQALSNLWRDVFLTGPYSVSSMMVRKQRCAV